VAISGTTYGYQPMRRHFVILRMTRNWSVTSLSADKLASIGYVGNLEVAISLTSSLASTF